jgi:murein DD-endopeptidase MepM/ murein hydrolase activator NlpD
MQEKYKKLNKYNDKNNYQAEHKVIEMSRFKSKQNKVKNWKLVNSFYNAKGRRTGNILVAENYSSGNIKLNLPVKGRVIIASDYGEDRGSYRHRGIDFDGKMGDSIYSAAGGKVIYAGYTESGGNEVVIQHSNNLMTRYAHLDEINVKEFLKIFIQFWS